MSLSPNFPPYFFSKGNAFERVEHIPLTSGVPTTYTREFAREVTTPNERARFMQAISNGGSPRAPIPVGEEDKESVREIKGARWAAAARSAFVAPNGSLAPVNQGSPRFRSRVLFNSPQKGPSGAGSVSFAPFTGR